MKMKVNGIKKSGESWKDANLVISNAAQVNAMMLDGITHVQVVGAGDYMMGEKAMMNWIECEG